jgi:tRNA pseudouridine13 synthase
MSQNADVLEFEFQCSDIKPEEESSPIDKDYSTQINSFRILCGDADADALKALLVKISSGSDEEIDPIILSSDSDKLHRSVSFSHLAMSCQQ